jgi:hypothetical protein
VNPQQEFDEDQFAHAVIRIQLGDEWLEISPGESGVSNPRSLDGLIHVVSGCNPGYRETEQVNSRLHQELELRLRELGSDPRPAVGMSPDGSWLEPSWAVVGLSRETVCALGREFGQVAVFEIDSQRIQVVQCADSEVVSARPCRVVEVPLSGS